MTCEPTWKNVARAWWRARTSRMRGVQTGSGPSSKVSAMVFGGMPRLLTVSPGPRRWTAAPAVTMSAAGVLWLMGAGPLPSLPTWLT